MTTKSNTAQVALSVMPLEWTDLCMIGKLLPAQQSGPLSVILEQLERSGEIEVRQAANPQRIQVRKSANIEQPPKPAA